MHDFMNSRIVNYLHLDNKINIISIESMNTLRFFIFLLFAIFMLFRNAYAWCQQSILKETAAVQCVDYSRDGKYLVTTTSTHATIWKVSTKQIYHQFSVSNCYCAKFSDNNPTTRLAISSQSDVSVYDLATLTKVTTSYDPGVGTVFMHIDFRNDDRVLSCSAGSNRVRVFDVGVDPANRVINQNDNDISFCKYAYSGQIGTTILPTNNNDKIHYLSADAQTQNWEEGGIDDCIELAFNKDSTRMIAACYDGSGEGFLIKNIHTGGRSVNMKIKTGNQLNTVAYSRDDDHYVFGGVEKVVYIFDVATDTLISKFITNDTIKDSDFTDDGNYLIIGCSDGRIYIYARYCIGCDPGYYFDSGTQQCIDCWSSMNGCGSCQDPSVCIQCVQGYILNTATDKCDDCKINLVGCGSCIDANNCSYCLPGYYLDTSGANYVCQRCQDLFIGCYVCANDSTCLQCESDYYLDTTTDQCVKCTNVNPYCIKCYSSTYCSQCQIGFYQNSGACTPCSTGCYACQTANNCTDCFQGYYPKNVGGNLVCTQCPYGCLACNATGACTDCFDEKFLTGTGTCDACSYPCSTCKSTATACLSCVTGYFISSGTTCTKCPFPCITCNDSSTCLSCPPSYFLDGTDCTLCHTQYGNCSSCDETECFVCLMGYYLDKGVSPTECKSCLSDMNGCVSCNTSINCLICASGYYHSGTANNGNNSCIICPLGCVACYSFNNCTNCHNGFYLDTVTDTCKLCTNRCVRCTSSSSCLECQTGFYLSGTTTCQSCSNIDTNCVACAYDTALTTTICTSCRIGMFYDSINDKCQKCHLNCSACIDATNCTTCMVGRYLDTVLDECLPCHQNCSQCVSSTFCMSCNAGYYLTGTNTCESCQDKNCATCNSTTFDCFECKIGFYLVTTTTPISCRDCLLQISHCSVCTDDTNCELCSYGYALAANKKSCQPCSDIEGCKHCLTLSSCENCEIGYYLVPDGSGNGICTQCGTGCRDCDSSGVCTECVIQYTMIMPGNTCSRCQTLMEGCLECSAPGTCTLCRIGFYLNTTSGDCKLCANSLFACLYCDDNLTCTHCSDGYYLDTINDICEPCDKDLRGCQLCNSSTVCLSCQFGLFLDNNECYLCEANISNCQYCEDANTCKFCKSGSFLSLGVCALCEAHIPGCTLCNSDVECLQCEGGYYLDSISDLCQACPQQGCQICQESNPNKCVSCNSKFYLNTTQQNCILCRDTLDGCMECLNSTQCSRCDVGFFVNSTFDCELCSNPLTGCGRCESETTCLECKAPFYLLPNNTCRECKSVIKGCMYCINDTECQSCWHGYYLSSADNLCYSCNNIDGCVSCLSENHCLYCEPDYFLQKSDNLCYPCNTTVGCYACVSNTTCSICSGGFIINNNQLCSKMRVQAYETVEDLKLVTLYLNDSALKHKLYAKGMGYDQSVQLTAIDWSNTTKLVLQDSTYEQQDLTIKKVSWGQANNILEFITNNPLKIQKKNYDLIKETTTTTRMLLEGTIPDQFKIHLKMDQKTINTILPSFFHNQDLIMDYDIDSPDFVKSYIQATSSTLDLTYAIFGISLTIILLSMYVLKAAHTVPQSYEMGSIMPHVFANKVPALILYPTYVEFISYCYGFMTADLPWANKDLGSSFGELTDITPPSYLFLYTNLNIGSTYFIAMISMLFIGLVLYIYYRSKEDEYKQRFPMGNVMINFFIFGVSFAGCICIIGALENKIQAVNINTIFYMVGIALDSFILGFITYKIYSSRHNFCVLRAFIKASLLGLATFSPIYIFFAAIFVDLICLIIQFCLTHRYHNLYPKLWVIKHLCLDLSLCLMVLDPQIKLTIIIGSLLIGFAVILDIYTHIQEYRNKKNDSNFKTLEMSQKSSTQQINNIWDINFDKSEKEPKGTFQEGELNNTKTTFNNTKNSSFGNEYIARRNKFKRHRNQPKPDVMHVVSTNPKQPQEKIDEYFTQTKRW